MKKIAIFMDGTWNEPNPDDRLNTNVYKLFKACSQTGDNFTWYESGVGTRWYDRISGGAFGYGIDVKIKDAYRQICNQFQPGSEIYLCGFSRGAYAARSLSGLIRKCGVLKKPTDENIDRAYSLYRDIGEAVDSAAATRFRNENSTTTDIKAIGVWDTVGELGIPKPIVDKFPFLEGSQFHDTTLSSHVQNAFHALAIDEHRDLFAPTLWREQGVAGQKVEQVWFPGAHADVGGGYEECGLSNWTLRWMADRLGKSGLSIDNGKLPDVVIGALANSPIHNSMNTPVFQIVCSPMLRPIDLSAAGGQLLDDTVFERLMFANPPYAPDNLMDALHFPHAQPESNPPEAQHQLDVILPSPLPSM